MEEKLKNIVSGAMSLFNKYSIRSVSMDDIARELGISKKTLYQHVSNKTNLIEKILELENEYVTGMVDEILNKDLNAIDRLLEVSKELSEHHKKTNPSIKFDLIKYYPETHKKHSEKWEKSALNYITNNMKQGIKEGLFRKDLDIGLTANMYIKKIEDITDPDFFTEGDFSFSKIFNVMFENHIRGISNEKGIKYFEKQKKLLNF